MLSACTRRGSMGRKILGGMRPVAAVTSRSAGGWRFAVLCTITVLPLIMAGCNRSRPAQWGEPADASNAVPLSRALQDYDSSNSQTVTISGRITEVCKASGCWFVLQDSSEGRDYQLYVDLTHGATFTVPPDVQGWLAVVKGRIVGQKPDLKFYAVGLSLIQQ